MCANVYINLYMYTFMTIMTIVKTALQGTVTFKAESAGLIHVPIGNMSFTETQLQENLRAVMVCRCGCMCVEKSLLHMSLLELLLARLITYTYIHTYIHPHTSTVTFIKH